MTCPKNFDQDCRPSCVSLFHLSEILPTKKHWGLFISSLSKDYLAYERLMYRSYDIRYLHEIGLKAARNASIFALLLVQDIVFST